MKTLLPFGFLLIALASGCGSNESAATTTGGPEAGAAGACAVSPTPDAGAEALDGGFWVNNPGGDVVNYDWSCGTDVYRLTCACNEFDSPADPRCTCTKNGQTGQTFTWTCGDADPALPGRCGYPVPQ